MSYGKLTMIQIVQKALEALNLDQVNSISDSPDAEQIAQIAQSAAYELLNQSEWPFAIRYSQLESIADADRPNYLKIPNEVTRIDFIRYDNTDPANVDSSGNDLIEIETIEWLAPEDFMEMTLNRNSQSESVEAITDFNGTQHLIFNDRGPQYWTSFDDNYVVFDAINKDIESTLQGIKSQCYVKWIQDITIDDDFLLEAPPHFFATWLAETISTAFIYMKQEASPKDEQRARRGLAVLRRNASRTDNDDGKVKYGRRR